MTVAAMDALRPFTVVHTAPPYVPRVGEARAFSPVPEVTAIRPTDRVTVYQLRPDGRLEFIQLRPARRAYQRTEPPPDVGANLDVYA